MKHSPSIFPIMALALCTGHAQAEGMRLDAGLLNVSIGVIDLTPDDGVEASFSYQSAYNRYDLEVYSNINNLRQEVIYEPVGAAAVDYRMTAGATKLGAFGDATFGGVGVEGQVQHNIGASGYGSLRAAKGYTITLAAHSALTISGNAFVVTRYFNGVDNFQTAYGIASVRLYPEGTFTGPEYDLIAYGAESYLRENFSLYYANTSDQALTLTADFVVGAGSTIIAASVPEPATWAMLGIGLLAVASAARRRA
ncbi:putative secreted protein with PEP-CTERM sorting signal [Pseudoduganella lurida]|uniref:Putative secreted protein with PEP-CTERM sorting signal n=1 Tax=Pseudoduganella lurida TaxID=1036180 RepID=A0A562RKN2_9BURK|nr:PEP-CTERM sorting domain-containing protein [Pseudoduganella lurida]TWI69483.1 putative secreted protein with PEP-CTERM sorting signal [Pseudoduganella lurida]